MEHPLIEIGWAPNSAGCALYVQDNGVGFDRHHAKRQFGPGVKVGRIPSKLPQVSDGVEDHHGVTPRLP